MVTSMKENEMTPKERWLAVLKRKKPDRVPMDYWAPVEVTERLIQHIGCKTIKEMLERLHIDSVIGIGPKYIGSPISEDSDIFGCRYRNMEYGTGVYRECIYHPLAHYKTVQEIKRNFV